MSNVEVPFEGKSYEKAVLLLAAAEELGLDPSVVQTSSGMFLVPEEVEKKAFSEEPKVAKKSTPKKAQE